LIDRNVAAFLRKNGANKGNIELRPIVVLIREEPGPDLVRLGCVDFVGGSWSVT